MGPSATGWSNWVGRIHIMCSGPFRDHYGTPGAPKRARFGPGSPFWGPRRSLGSHGGPNLGPSATGWSNWVSRIHIMCLGPLRDLYVLSVFFSWVVLNGLKWRPNNQYVQVSSCNIPAMWPTQLDQPVAVGPKSGPPGLPKALRGPKKGLSGPKWALLGAPGVP